MQGTRHYVGILLPEKGKQRVSYLLIEEVGDALDELSKSGKPTSLGLSSLNRLSKLFLLFLDLGELVCCRVHRRDVVRMGGREVGKGLT